MKTIVQDPSKEGVQYASTIQENMTVLVYKKDGTCKGCLTTLKSGLWGVKKGKVVGHNATWASQQEAIKNLMELEYTLKTP